MVSDFVSYFWKWSQNAFMAFMASLQMQFSQSSAHVECFLIPVLKTTRKHLSKNGFGFCLTFLEVVTKCILKRRFLPFFAVFMASLQMQFSQSSDHVEQFLIPFQKTTMKNLSKNGFGICLTFLEVVTKCNLKNTFSNFLPFLGLTSNGIFSVI